MEDPRKMVEGIRNKIEAKEAIETMFANWDALIIAFTGMAKVKKATFDALIEQGFSERQALVLTDLQFKGFLEGGKG